MNDLVLVRDGDVFTDSLIIAKGTENEHESIVALIKKYSRKFESIGRICFSDLKSGKRGRPQRVYRLNESQATFLITLLNNNDIVVDFKLELVRQFFAMRQMLMQRQTQDWQQTRRIGKIVRSEETDMIKQLIDYAKTQGNKNCHKLYVVYTKLANQVIGVRKRDDADVIQLNNLSLAENIIINCIREGVAAHKHYKAIYQDCKARLYQFKQIAYLS